jgi:hypothetical protein
VPRRIACCCVAARRMMKSCVKMYDTQTRRQHSFNTHTKLDKTLKTTMSPFAVPRWTCILLLLQLLLKTATSQLSVSCAPNEEHCFAVHIPKVSLPIYCTRILSLLVAVRIIQYYSFNSLLLFYRIVPIPSVAIII